MLPTFDFDTMAVLAFVHADRLHDEHADDASERFIRPLIGDRPKDPHSGQWELSVLTLSCNARSVRKAWGEA